MNAREIIATTIADWNGWPDEVDEHERDEAEHIIAALRAHPEALVALLPEQMRADLAYCVRDCLSSFEPDDQAVRLLPIVAALEAT